MVWLYAEWCDYMPSGVFICRAVCLYAERCDYMPSGVFICRAVWLYAEQCDYAECIGYGERCGYAKWLLMPGGWLSQLVSYVDSLVMQSGLVMPCNLVVVGGLVIRPVVCHYLPSSQ